MKRIFIGLIILVALVGCISQKSTSSINNSQTKLLCEQTGGTYYECKPCPPEAEATCEPCPQACTCFSGKVWDEKNGCVQNFDTSGKTCTSDIECTCRGFTGAKFLDEAVSSSCNLEMKTCVRCLYD